MRMVEQGEMSTKIGVIFGCVRLLYTIHTGKFIHFLGMHEDYRRKSRPSNHARDCTSSHYISRRLFRLQI
jgi:hypothetical protein